MKRLRRVISALVIAVAAVTNSGQSVQAYQDTRKDWYWEISYVGDSGREWRHSLTSGVGTYERLHEIYAMEIVPEDKDIYPREQLDIGIFFDHVEMENLVVKDGNKEVPYRIYSKDTGVNGIINFVVSYKHIKTGRITVEAYDTLEQRTVSDTLQLIIPGITDQPGAQIPEILPEGDLSKVNMYLKDYSSQQGKYVSKNDPNFDNQNIAVKAFDEDSNSMWCAQSQDYSDYIIGDMGELIDITQIKIGVPEGREYTYEISSSANGVDYDTVDDYDRSFDGTNEIVGFRTRNARYVKVRITGCNNIQDGWSKINDIAVYKLAN